MNYSHGFSQLSHFGHTTSRLFSVEAGNMQPQTDTWQWHVMDVTCYQSVTANQHWGLECWHSIKSCFQLLDVLWMQPLVLHQYVKQNIAINDSDLQLHDWKFTSTPTGELGSWLASHFPQEKSHQLPFRELIQWPMVILRFICSVLAVLKLGMRSAFLSLHSCKIHFG